MTKPPIHPLLRDYPAGGAHQKVSAWQAAVAEVTKTLLPPLLTLTLDWGDTPVALTMELTSRPRDTSELYYRQRDTHTFPPMGAFMACTLEPGRVNIDGSWASVPGLGVTRTLVFQESFGRAKRLDPNLRHTLHLLELRRLAPRRPSRTDLIRQCQLRLAPELAGRDAEHARTLRALADHGWTGTLAELLATADGVLTAQPTHPGGDHR